MQNAKTQNFHDVINGIEVDVIRFFDFEDYERAALACGCKGRKSDHSIIVECRNPLLIDFFGSDENFIKLIEDIREGWF